MQRLRQIVLIGSTVVASWLGMQAVHESGHVLGALVSGGAVKQVVLHPLTISRTDLSANPSPLLTVWAGPVIGILLPLILYGVAAQARMSGAFVLRFFAGFCLIANGAYIGAGSFDGVGDCGTMLRHGSEPWQLWLFGAVCVPAGFWLWHRQGRYFGLGTPDGTVHSAAAYGTFCLAILLAAFAFLVGGD